jgi:hypothetical protein
MKYPATESTSRVPQAQSSGEGMVKDSFSAPAFDVAGHPVRSTVLVRLEKFQNPENLRVYSRMSAFAAQAAHISGEILTPFLSRSEIACVRARHQAIGKLTCR